MTNRNEENMNHPTTMKLATLTSALMIVSVFASAYPVVHAYGPAQWQATFSGTFATPGGNRTGFWGWCMFGGSAPDGMIGTESDCQVTNYSFTANSGANTGFLLHEAIHGTAWSIAPATFPSPGLPPDNFFITDGSVSFTSQIFRQPPPPNCMISGQTVTCMTPTGPVTCMISGQTLTCSIAGATALHLYMPDTFIPAAPNHYSFAKISENMFGMEVPPGVHINIQVNQLP
jgi:hypothetical protein